MENTMNEDSNKLTIEHKLQLLSTIGSWKESESNKYWTRFNIFLALNTGLLAAVGVALDSDSGSFQIVIAEDWKLSVILVLCFVGLVISLIWFELLKVAKYYESRLIHDINELVTSDSGLKEYVSGYSDDSSPIKSPTTFKATTYAKFVVIVFVLLWAFLCFATFLI